MEASRECPKVPAQIELGTTLQAQQHGVGTATASDLKGKEDDEVGNL